MGRPPKKRPISVKAYLGADGDWHAYITAGVNEDGSPRRLHRQGRTQDIVEDKVRDVEDLIAAGRPVPRGRSAKLALWLLHWLDVECAELAYKTRVAYRSDIQRFLIPRRGHLNLDQQTRTSVATLFADLREEGISSWVRLSVYKTWRAANNAAIKAGRMTIANPVAQVDAPTVTSPEVEPLSVDEARRALAAAQYNRDGMPRRNRARWSIALALGHRQGEALGFEWRRPRRRTGDIDLEARTIRVRDQLQRHTYEHGCADPHACTAAVGCGMRHKVGGKRGCGKPGCRPSRHRFEPCRISRRDGLCIQHRTYDNGTVRAYTRGCPPPCEPGCTGHARHCPDRVGGLVKVAPKSDAALRTAVLPDPLWLELVEHKRAQDAERAAAGSQWQDNGLVFCGPLGQPIDPRRDWEEWCEILDLAGIDPARLHDARHTAATILLLMGVDPRTVMSIMGWSQFAMLKRYQHVVDQLRREAANRVSAALWGTPGAPVPLPGAQPAVGGYQALAIGPATGIATDHATGG